MYLRQILLKSKLTFSNVGSTRGVPTEIWVRGSPGRSHHQRNGWTNLTLSSAVRSVTMVPVLNAAYLGKRSIVVVFLSKENAKSRACTKVYDAHISCLSRLTNEFCLYAGCVEYVCLEERDMKNLIGEASCRICQESFSTNVTALTEPIDIYSDGLTSVNESIIRTMRMHREGFFQFP
ncbi:Transcription elongation factor 1 [Sesamum angolense]|uniref:Transcription elongation factor 1 homolog n=1 Tax=Sesamum angolense TaxID=2727404 RepID=A0AAE2BIY2_9LAMI|nr:Transcription elongation factor 1 [Sesamum angolense]